jgi:double-stranded uracil-DNA glycosylase
MLNALCQLNGFAPIVSGNASVLILGSMPSEASLLRQQYYGHPRNAFWPIMSALFGSDSELSYQRRKEMLMENGIAVWDVLQSCNRLGSSDSNIKLAEKLYQKQILPALNHRFSYLEYQCLPSTSPAYASLKFEQKIEAWKAIKQHMVK